MLCILFGLLHEHGPRDAAATELLKAPRRQITKVRQLVNIVAVKSLDGIIRCL